MAIKIDRELAGDVNNPSKEVIAFALKELKKLIPRYQMLEDYYEGNPHKINEVPTSTPHERGEVYVNNAKYVTDSMVGFMVGNPISYAPGKGKNIDPIIDVYEQMRIKKHDKEIEKDLSVFGIAYELQYLSVILNTTTTVQKITKIDPRGIILVTDDTVDANKLFAVRPIEKFNLNGKRIGYHIEVYTPDRVLAYSTKNWNMKDAVLLKDKVKPQYFGDVQVTEFRNNEEKQGDYEQQLSQIDGYNELQTDRIKDKKNFVKALMILYGFSLPEQKPGEINGSLVLNAPSKEEGGHAEYVSNTFQESEVQVLADSLIDDFHKTSYVPNMNDEKFGGNISGEAMKYKLLGLLLALATKIGYFEDGLIQRLKLTENMLRVKGYNVDSDGAKITFKPNLPINRKDIIDQIRDSQEFVPLLVSLGWLDGIDDPKEVLEMLDEQKMKTIEMQLKAQGESSSHSNIDLGNKEDEDDDGSNIDKKSTDFDSKK